ncbi:hypothetical protein J4463_00870, partial [Candidatus Pacearchaeota archaeon]|nr:hypothetical protein [Candidatus Pacearchaeota archaeon]
QQKLLNFTSKNHSRNIGFNFNTPRGFSPWVVDRRIMEMINIPRAEYERLKMQANIDVDLLKQLVRSVKDIKEGRLIRVK